MLKGSVHVAYIQNVLDCTDSSTLHTVSVCYITDKVGDMTKTFKKHILVDKNLTAQQISLIEINLQFQMFSPRSSHFLLSTETVTIE